MRALGSLLLACALLGGCEEPKLPKSWRVTYARVLAVRAEVIGDAARATPEPGERVRLSVLIVGEEPIEYLSYALVVCPASPPRGELPSCASAPIAVEQRELDGEAGLSRELVLEVDVPEADDLDGAERLLLGGTICTDGTAAASDNGVGRCEDGDVEPVTFAAHVVLALEDDDVNHNPVLAADAIRFDDEAWSPTGALEPPVDEDDAGVDDAGVSDAGGPVSARADGEEHEIAISLEDSARDTVEGSPEELLLSHFVTVGVLERRFSVLLPEQDGSEPLLLKWHMPKRDDPPARMLAVFVARDQRGGVDYTLREVAIE